MTPLIFKALEQDGIRYKLWLLEKGVIEGRAYHFSDLTSSIAVLDARLHPQEGCIELVDLISQPQNMAIRTFLLWLLFDNLAVIQEKSSVEILSIGGELSSLDMGYWDKLVQFYYKLSLLYPAYRFEVRAKGILYEKEHWRELVSACQDDNSPASILYLKNSCS